MPNSTQRKQQARKLAQLIEALDLDSSLQGCLEVRALKAETPEEWADIKRMNDLRQQFLTLVNVIATQGPLEYKLERDGSTAGESGSRPNASET